MDVCECSRLLSLVPDEAVAVDDDVCEFECNGENAEAVGDPTGGSPEIGPPALLGEVEGRPDTIIDPGMRIVGVFGMAELPPRGWAITELLGSELRGTSDKARGWRSPCGLALDINLLGRGVDPVLRILINEPSTSKLLGFVAFEASRRELGRGGNLRKTLFLYTTFSTSNFVSTNNRLSSFFFNFHAIKGAATTKPPSTPEPPVPEVDKAVPECSSGRLSLIMTPGAGNLVTGNAARTLSFIYASTDRTLLAKEALIIELTAAGIEPA